MLAVSSFKEQLDFMSYTLYSNSNIVSWQKYSIKTSKETSQTTPTSPAT